MPRSPKARTSVQPSTRLTRSMTSSPSAAPIPPILPVPLIPPISNGRFVLIVPPEPVVEAVSSATQHPPIPRAAPRTEKEWNAFMVNYYNTHCRPIPDSQDPTIDDLEAESRTSIPWDVQEPRVAKVVIPPQSADEDGKEKKTEEQRPVDEEGARDQRDRSDSCAQPTLLLLDERYPFERFRNGGFTFTFLHPQRLAALALEIDDMHSADDLLQRLRMSSSVVRLVRSLRLHNRRSPGLNPPLTSYQFIRLLQLLPNCTGFDIEDIAITGSLSEIRDDMAKYGVSPRSVDKFTAKFSKAFTSTVRHDLLEVFLAPFLKLKTLEVQLHRCQILDRIFSLPEGFAFEEVEDPDTPSPS